MAIVAVGNIQFSAADTQVHGLLYSQAATWVTAGTNGTLHGAAIGEGNIAGNAAIEIKFDKAMLDLLHYRTGSFVIVPGTWKDFR